MIERRQFIQMSAALAFSGVAQGAEPNRAFAGRISRIAFLDDAASLAAAGGEVPARTARAILSNRSLFLGGGALDAAGAQPDQALAIAASREAAMAYAPLEPGSEKDKLQRDARLLRALVARAGKQGFHVTSAEVANLFDTLNRRVLIGIHTYIPDEHDVEGWMERLIRLHDEAQAYFGSLASAFLAAKPVDDAFFDAQDPVVRAAASVDYGPLDRATLRSALAAKQKSAYGTALLEAHRRMAQI